MKLETAQEQWEFCKKIKAHCDRTKDPAPAFARRARVEPALIRKLIAHAERKDGALKKYWERKPQDGTWEGLLYALESAPGDSWSNMQVLAELLANHVHPNRSPEAKGGPVIAIVGLGANCGGGPPSPWSGLAAEVLAPAATAFGVHLPMPEGESKLPDSRRRAKNAREERSFYRGLWQTLGTMSDMGLMPGRETEAQKGIEALIKSKKLQTQHICAAVWENPVAREGLLHLLERRCDTSAEGPALANALIAHFVNCGLFDHAISVGIDDALDRSLDNELGRNNYDRILSASSELSSEPSRPCLVKLHGSIDTPATLSFQSTLRGWLPPELMQTLDRVIWRDAPQPPKARIVSLGYSWRDTALARWACSRADHIEHIFIVRRGQSEPRLPPSLEPVAKSCRVIALEELQSHRRKLPDELNVAHFLWSLSQLLQTTLKDKFPGISRHLILAALFSWPFLAKDDKNDVWCFRNDHSFKNRFFAEMLLHVAKCKGMVNTYVMASDPRLSSLLDEARRCGEDDLHPARFLKEHCAGNEASIDTALFTASSAAAATDTYFSSVDKVSDLAGCFRKGLKYLATHGGTTIERSHHVGRPKVSKRAHKIELDHRNTIAAFIQEEVTNIFKGADVEVRREPDPRLDWIFSKYERLHRHGDLWTRVENLVLRPDWTDLLVITEWSGRHKKMLDRMLKRKKSDLKWQNVLLLEPSHFSLENWKLRDAHFKLRGRLRTDDGPPARLIRQIPWWAHNNHFTLALQDGNFLGATFARRDLKASSISPVFTNHWEDCTQLLIAFLTRLPDARDLYKDNDAAFVTRHETFLKASLHIAEEVLSRLTSSKKDQALATKQLRQAIDELRSLVESTSISPPAAHPRSASTLRVKPGPKMKPTIIPKHSRVPRTAPPDPTD